MKLYSFLYERGSYQRIYQSFNKKELEKQKAEFEVSFKAEGGPNKIGIIEEQEIDIKNGVWTA